MKVWLSDDPAGEIVWVSGAGHTGRADDLSGVPSDAPAAIIMPGQWGRIYALDLPKLRAAERLAAAGFAIEDKIASSPQSQHLVMSHDGDRVGVIAKRKMKSLSEAIAQTDLNVSGLYLDYDAALPGPAFKLQDRVIVPHSLTGGSDGYAADASFYEGAQTLPETDPAGQAVNVDSAINFATGAYAARRKGAFSVRALGRVAALAAILGVSFLGWQIAQARAGHAQAQYLKTQTAKQFTQLTGKSAPANPALTVTRALKSGGGQTADFLSLSAILFAALESTPGAQVETLDYDVGRAQLRLRVIYPDLQTATQMERAASALGATLSTGNLRERAGSMMGDAVLTEGGGL